MLKTLQGQASAWLLARPSHHQINRASLTIASALSMLIITGIFLISYLQWNLSERIQKNQIQRAETYLQESNAVLNMAIEFGNAHRSTLALLLARDPEESADALQRRQAALTAYQNGQTALQQGDWQRYGQAQQQLEVLLQQLADQTP